MARIHALPSLSIIRGFKGILDFYVWRGLPCVRAWPKYRPAKQTPASLAAALTFGAIIKSYALLANLALEAYRQNALDQPRTARDIMVTGVFGHLHTRTIPLPPPPPEELMYDAYVCLRDVKPVTTDGGTFTLGAWRTRVLNNEQADQQAICTLAANQFVLAPGSYRCTISCPAHLVRHHQARLYNMTAPAVLLLGTVQYSHDTHFVTNRSLIVGRFTVAAAQTLQIQHICDRTQAATGFGPSSDFTDEIYTVAEFWREAPPA